MSDAFQFEKLPGEPIAIFKALPSYNMAADARASVEGAFEFFETIDEPVYYVHDFLDITPLNFEDVSIGAMTVAIAENPIFKHPKIREIIFVTTSDLLAMAAKGLDTEPYGNIKIHIFTRMEDALAYAREQA